MLMMFTHRFVVGLLTCRWLIVSGRFGGALTRNIRMLTR